MVLNPSEMLKKSRDAQRISDLTALKKAIEIYKTNIPSAKLAGANNTGCKGTTISTAWQPATDHIYYSLPTETGTITATVLDGTTFTTGGGIQQVAKSSLGKVDGNGWLPIDFSSLSGGSPISALPIDPVNTISSLSAPTNTDLVYRYICSEKDQSFEIDATLESIAYTSTDNKMSKDGGNNDSYYEVGTSLALVSIESPLACGLYTVVGSDGFTYGTVVGADTKCWLDRNLGATRVATAYNDSQSYGHLYQWGRYADGHQILTSSVTTGPVSTDTPGSSFVTVANVSPWDWRTPQQTLWSGINGTNNPCPSGFRIPTSAEWQTLTNAIVGFTTATCGGSSTCRETAAGSLLKLPSGGSRAYSSAELNNLGFNGSYWSSSPNGVYAYNTYFTSTAVYPVNTNNRANGFSVRCIKD